MAGTVVAVFEDHQAATTAANALLDANVAFGDISLVRKGAGGELGDIDVDLNHPDDDDEEFLSRGFREVSEHDVEQPMDMRAERAPRMITGVVAGAPLGALLMATAVAIPGIGPIIVAGPLTSIMTATLAGGVLGGLIGALTSGGIPVKDAQDYHDHVAKGDTLVTVLVGRHRVEKIQRILEQAGGHDVKYFQRLIDSLQSIKS